MPKKNKQLDEFENNNNQELKKMFDAVGEKPGFNANIIVSDQKNILFKRTAEVELLIDMGVKFHFEEKDLTDYKKLGLVILYYLNEATMKFMEIYTREDVGISVVRKLHLELKSGITIIIEDND